MDGAIYNYILTWHIVYPNKRGNTWSCRRIRHILLCVYDSFIQFCISLQFMSDILQWRHERVVAPQSDTSLNSLFGQAAKKNIEGSYYCFLFCFVLFCFFGGVNPTVTSEFLAQRESSDAESVSISSWICNTIDIMSNSFGIVHVDGLVQGCSISITNITAVLW